MKTTKPNVIKIISKLAMLMLFLFAFSCNSDDSDPDKDDDLSYVLTEFASGAVLHGTNGIYFGPDDNLYIASFFGQNITVMNKQNGKILKQFGVGDGVLGPDDLDAILAHQTSDPTMAHPQSQFLQFLGHSRPPIALQA